MALSNFLCDCLGKLPDSCKSGFASFTISVLFMIPYMLILQSCPLLILRLILQSAVFWCVLFVVIYTCTFKVIQTRLMTIHPTKRANIIKTKKIPLIPHPQIQQKTYAWLQYENAEGTDDYTAGKLSPSNSEDTEDETDIEVNPTESFKERHEALLKELKEWAHVPCVVLTSDQEWSKGDHVTVSLIDGNTEQPIYIPFMAELKRRMIRNVARNFLWGVGLSAATLVLFGQFFEMDSQTLEDDLNSRMDWFWGDLLGLDDDDDVDDVDSETPSCAIGQDVTVSYYVLIGLQMAFPTLAFAYFYYKKKRLLGMEDASPDSYQLLRGDEDFEDKFDAADDKRKVPTAED